MRIFFVYLFYVGFLSFSGVEAMSRCVANEFQWKNLYLQKYGVCCYPLESWARTVHEKSSYSHYPFEKLLIDDTFSFAQILALTDIFVDRNEGAEPQEGESSRVYNFEECSRHLEDIMLVYEKHTRKTLTLCSVIVTAVFSRHFDGVECAPFSESDYRTFFHLHLFEDCFLRGECSTPPASGVDAPLRAGGSPLVFASSICPTLDSAQLPENTRRVVAARIYSAACHLLVGTLGNPL